jgi:hypothetical protein
MKKVASLPHPVWTETYLYEDTQCSWLRQNCAACTSAVVVYCMTQRDSTRGSHAFGADSFYINRTSFMTAVKRWYNIILYKQIEVSHFYLEAAHKLLHDTFWLWSE